MRHLLSMLFFLVSSVVLGQQTASVVGALSDKENNNEPLAFANILIQGTTIGTTSDFDGLYELPNISPGNYTIIFSYLGYETVTVENVLVSEGKVTS